MSINIKNTFVIELHRWSIFLIAPLVGDLFLSRHVLAINSKEYYLS
ncbi:hypothetical protein [Magnetospira sp. QH-2]|nr:hypothetical protein [Magnetospira sp. QH-2]